MKTLLALLLAFVGGSAIAHPLAPALLQLEAGGQGHYQVLWRTDLRSRLQAPRWPDGCREGEVRLQRQGSALERRLDLHCAQDLGGRQLHLPGLAEARSTVLLRYRDAAGREFQRLLSAAEPAVKIPASLAGTGLWLQYLQLGIEHILAGLDHLLLVLALFLLARGWRRLLLDVTAFTLGHSLTLVAATLDWLWLPAAPVELAIALSILWLALVLAHGGRGHRHWLLFAAFGLIHGLGFAGALQELGLPRHDRLPALLCFNLGIEFGQILFLCGLAAGRRLLQGLAAPALPPLRWAGIYLLGAMASFWCLERGAQLLTGPLFPV